MARREEDGARELHRVGGVVPLARIGGAVAEEVHRLAALQVHDPEDLARRHDTRPLAAGRDDPVVDDASGDTRSGHARSRHGCLLFASSPQSSGSGGDALGDEPPARRPPRGAHGGDVRRVQPEQPLQVEGVLRGKILVVVVERHRDPAGVPVQAPGAAGELPELLRTVQVVVLLGHRRLAAGALLEPAPEVPAVQPEHGPLGRRRRLHPRLPHGVDRREDEAVPREERDDLVRPLRDPRLVPDLHRQREAREPRGERGEVGERRLLVADPGRQLEEDVAELAGRRQRLERRPEELEAAVERLGRDPLAVELAAAPERDVLRQHEANLGREGVEAGVVAGHEAVGLDVEEEARGRALGPERRVPRRGQRVVGGVDLDAVEEARVPAQPVLGRHRGPRVEAAGGDQRLVEPGRGADAVLGRGGGRGRAAPRPRARRDGLRRRRRGHGRRATGGRPPRGRASPRRRPRRSRARRAPARGPPRSPW